MSAEATGWVWRHSPYSGGHLLVHLAIADVVNDAHQNEFWMTVGALAAKTRLTRASVFAALRQMVDDELLIVLERGGGRGVPTRYRLLTETVQSLRETVQSSRRNGLDSGPRTKEPKELKDQSAAVQYLDPSPRTPAPWVPLGITREEWTRRDRGSAS